MALGTQRESCMFILSNCKRLKKETLVKEGLLTAAMMGLKTGTDSLLISNVLINGQKA